LLAAGSRWLRELRKWTFAPLGLVLVVVLLGAGVVAMLATGGDSPEKVIQRYFSSTAGGGAPSEQARLIEFNECHPIYKKVRDKFLDECSLEFRGRGYTGCFLWNDDGDRIVLGSRQVAGLVEGCDLLFWDQAAETLVTR
jgi:hypothetical protein